MGRASLIIPYMGILSIFLLTMRLGPADAAIGYDCGSSIQNMTTISLVDIDDCDLNITEVQEFTEDMALLQLNEFEQLKISQCKVEISRTIYYCGMHSHSSLVSNGSISYIEEISREDCENALKSGSIKLRGVSIADLKVNQVDRRVLTFAGTVDSDGACSRAHYEDPYGSWDGVTVTGTAIMTVTSKEARVKVEDDQIFLPSGYSCKLSKGECIDPLGGYTFWDPVPKEQCTSQSYSLLYKGQATKLVSNDEVVYTIKSDDTSFSFTAFGTVASCDITLLKTESPKLFIVDRSNIENLKNIKIDKKDTSNMDMFNYVNAKFVYVERHIRTQMKSLYTDVMMHTCKLEKEILKNTLAIASTQPDEFAFRFMEGPGYMAVLAGEVIHMVKCLPVEVTYRHVDKCYNRLPVLRGNDSMYLIPRTHILTKSANEIPCNRPLLEHYKLEGVWYKLMPQRVDTEPPMKLKPSSEMTWTYENPADLMNSGIYQSDDLDSMQERIINPIETKVITETFSQQITSGMTGSVDVKTYMLDYIKKDLFPDIWSLIWGPFSWFGSVAAGFVGIFIILKMIKFLLDVIVNAYTLYLKHGWSFRILGAFCISITNLSLLRTKEEYQEERETIELVKRREAKK